MDKPAKEGVAERKKLKLRTWRQKSYVEKVFEKRCRIPYLFRTHSRLGEKEERIVSRS